MKYIIIFTFISILNGCAVITNRASIQRDINEHYVEIYGGGLTPESALLEELHDFTKLICGENRYHFKNRKMVSAVSGSLPGTTCEIRGCVDHLVMQTKLFCKKTPTIKIHPKEESSRWLESTADQGLINDLLEDDYVIRELVESIGKPNTIYFNGKNEIILQYTEKNISVLFIRSLLLTGYQTRKMILKYGIY